MEQTEFLLARIAEVARRCGDVHHVNCAYARIPERECTCGNPAHVLAECEAKRRIVECAPRVSGLHDFWDGEQGQPGTAADPGEEILKALALPYAGHPDFQEEWQ